MTTPVITARAVCIPPWFGAHRFEFDVASCGSVFVGRVLLFRYPGAAVRVTMPIPTRQVPRHDLSTGSKVPAFPHSNRVGQVDEEWN